MSRDTTSSARGFSVFFLNKHKKLVPECVYYHNNIIWSRNGNMTGRIDYTLSTLSNDSYINLSYKVRRWNEEEWRPIDQKIKLESVACHYGGFRWYFRCNLFKNGVHCGRRVAILYSAGDYFGCRHCADLSYDSCNQSKKMRGFPWKHFTDESKADDLYEKVKVEYYKGKPTKKYKRCLDLWGYESEGTNAEEQLLKQL